MILIGIPYHPAKQYALTPLLTWINQQTGYEVVLRVDTGTYGRPDAVKQQLEFFRTLALDNRASHLLIVEADTIPPVDVVQRLVAHGMDIVGALYHYRDETHPAVAWPKENITTGLCEVDGMGTGCVLLSNRALQEFSFFDWDGTDADYPMYDALKAKGYPIYLDAETVCRHYADANTWY